MPMPRAPETSTPAQGHFEKLLRVVAEEIEDVVAIGA
jgi:hypothetical protein